MKVLLTGSDGYIGSVLGPQLAEAGFEVTGVDTGFYAAGRLYHTAGVLPRTLRRDIRDLTESDLAGFDAVVHMAELSNDPAGALNPAVTYEINHRGSVRLAEMSAAAGVRRFVYMSSCSVYGVASADLVTEASPVNPQTDYARCKVLVERDVTGLASSRFSPVFLRNATVFGASPHMRFDLVLNNLCGFAATTGEIRVLSDGTPWRPLVHVRDLCRVIQAILGRPAEHFHGHVVNVGSTNQNYTVREIAEAVARVFEGCRLTFGEQSADNRSYRVSFAKLQAMLPDFEFLWPAEAGARELHDIFSRIHLTEGDFKARPWTRLAMLRYLSETAQIDEQFFWNWTPAKQPQDLVMTHDGTRQTAAV
jgi:nucleoside-diphosphate-sugar epimerase